MTSVERCPLRSNGSSQYNGGNGDNYKQNLEMWLHNLYLDAYELWKRKLLKMH
jgi:hypothetical protein